MASRSTAPWMAIICLLIPSAVLELPATETPPVTFASLLAEMTDRDAIARWPVPAFTCRQASSYDRARKAPGEPQWFANNDHSQYVRSEDIGGKRRHVLMDVAGPGAIVRFWLTTNNVKSGRLCITLDGASEPTIVFPAYDLLSGGIEVGSPWITAHPEYAREGGGGNTMYLPIPYAKHCLVTWEDADATKTGPRYYQLNYRTYAAGTVVESFSATALSAARAELAERGRLLLASDDHPAGQALVLNQTIAAASSATLALPPGPAAVRHCELSVDLVDKTTAELCLRGLILRMECDGEETVWCPVSDFFGSGIGCHAVQNWNQRVITDGTLACRWTMPYQSTARITLSNLGAQALAVSLRTISGPWTWDARSLHFRSVWHQQADITTPPVRDWSFVAISGKGVYVGDSLALFNPVATWYGEGDEKIWVDDESFPSHIGTGTEDYYNYSWAPKPVFRTPFANHVRMDQSMTRGWNVMDRMRLLDGIPFTSAFRFDLELIPWKTTTLTCAATTYWYAMPGATTTQQPAPTEALRPLPSISTPRTFAGALEGERLSVVKKSDGVTIATQSMDAWDAMRWSGGEHALVRTKQIGDAVEFAIPVSGTAAKRLTVHLTRAPDYGIIRFSLNGIEIAQAFDGYAAQVEPSGAVDLGTVTPVDGRVTLRLALAGKNPQASGEGRLMGLDAVVVRAP